MIDHRPCGPAALVTCTKAGVYTLYSYNSQRIESTTVQPGEPVGFVRGRGTLLAVAGNDHQIPLTDGGYCWIFEPPGQVPARPVGQRYFNPYASSVRPETGYGAAVEGGLYVLRWLAMGAPDAR
jgi:hypothetical protein